MSDKSRQKERLQWPLSACAMLSSLHPILWVSFLTGAVVLSMFSTAVSYLIASFCGALLLYIALKGRRAWRMSVFACVVLAGMTILNPLFNTQGNTILFILFGTRPYTFEALVAGLFLGLIVASLTLWFACFNVLFDSAKLAYLLGRVAPRSALVFTLVLRLIPLYQEQGRQVIQARKGLRLYAVQSSLRERVGQSITALVGLFSWALDRGVVMADSMTARGFGVGSRTSYVQYVFAGREKRLTMAMMACLVVAMYGIVTGSVQAILFPVIQLPVVSFASCVSTSATVLYFGIPLGYLLKERLVWACLLLKM